MGEPDATQALGEVLVGLGVVVYAVTILTGVRNGTFPGVCLVAAGGLALAYATSHQDESL